MKMQASHFSCALKDSFVDKAHARILCKMIDIIIIIIKSIITEAKLYSVDHLEPKFRHLRPELRHPGPNFFPAVGSTM